PAPPIATSWVWIAGLSILIGLLVVILFHNPGSISYSDFVKLVFQPELNKHLKKITLFGPERINGEVDDPEALPKEIRDKLDGKASHPLRPPLEDQGELMKQLDKLTLENNLEVIRLDDWLNTWGLPLLTIFLLAGLPVAILLYFLPRIRESMGGGFLNNYI